MSKNTIKMILLFGILVYALGLWGALTFVGDIIEKLLAGLIQINYDIYLALGESLLSGIFKHFITYKIVGLILTSGIAGGSAFLGKWIGKTAYIIVGIGVVAILNFITILFV
jgi:hypothetical protein